VNTERKEPDWLRYPAVHCAGDCGALVYGEEGAMCESCRLFLHITRLEEKLDELIALLKGGK
jgi:hypothetical protein